jgi:hypothetical protein
MCTGTGTYCLGDTYAVQYIPSVYARQFYKGRQFFNLKLSFSYLRYVN